MPDPDSAGSKQAETQFKPGQSGNPAGRPKGTRNKLGEQFLEDMLADWKEHGAKVIEDVRSDRPQDYLKVVASILPKELQVKVSDLDELTDEQLARQFIAIASQLAAAGFDLGAGDGQAAPTQPPSGIPTIQ